MGSAIKKIRVACTHQVEGARNPYLRLLYYGGGESSREDSRIDVVESPGVSLSWIWKNRRIFDILHLHWPSYLYDCSGTLARWFRLFRMACGLVLTRLIGKKVVWTAHNVMPHKSLGFIDDIARIIVVKLSHLILANHKAALADLNKRFGGCGNTSVVPHMTYDGLYSGETNQTHARRKLGLPESELVVIHFGVGRRNKNLDKVISSFVNAQPSGVILLIAGECSKDLAAVYKRAGIDHPQIVWHDRHIQDDEVATYLNAADVAVVASEITTSGTLYLYLSFALPAIIPAVLNNEFDEEFPWLISIEIDDGKGLEHAFRDIGKVDLQEKRRCAGRLREKRHSSAIHAEFVRQMGLLLQG